MLRFILSSSLLLSLALFCSPTQAQDYNWLSANCRIDRLVETSYAKGWLEWQRATGFSPKGVPLPTSLSPAPPSDIQKVWASDPQSHVVDCTFRIPRRKCPSCRGGGTDTASYVAYLPQALFEHPKAVRSILLLIPGGNGLRTRYFLTPIPGKTIFDKMSGGLETQRHLDTLLAEDPDLVPPIVVALDSAGWLFVNGPVEYITYDLPHHIAATYLPSIPYRDIALGGEGISSGGRAIMESLRRKPDVFNTVGLTAMHCRNFGGIDPKKHLGPETAKQAWLRHLANRSRAGLLHIRFSMGNEDAQWPCNKEFHDLFVEAGILPVSSPTYGECRKGYKPSPDVCTTFWEGFYLYDGIPHHYGIFKPSYKLQLGWHLQRLTKTAAALDRGVSQP